MSFASIAAAMIALAAQTGPRPTQDDLVVDMWPRTGAWITALTRAHDGRLFCSLVTGPQETATGESASFGFTMAGEEILFSLYLRGAKPVSVASLQMEADGSRLLDMPLVKRSESGGSQRIEAHVAGGDFVRIVERNLEKPHQVTIRAGEQAYVVPHEQFANAVRTLSVCMDEAHQRNAGQAR
jgi:hypothetical protein